MNIYRRFARIYAHGPYPGYSLTLLDALPGLFEHYNIPGRGRLLDVACGEGSFAVAMAQSGWQVTGIDQSAEMLQLAREHAKASGVEVDFRQGDMREPFDLAGYDLATCWYDSLNYLLTPANLAAAFANARAALKPDGWFVFDMNTIYGLAFGWQQKACYVQQDNLSVFELHRASYNFEEQIASLHMTAFEPVGENKWERIDEIHRERGYPLKEIQSLLEEVGLKVVEVLGSIRDFSAPRPDSQRAWFLARNAGEEPDKH